MILDCIDIKYLLLIGFEGMDASYKETNSKRLFSFLKDDFFKEYIKENKMDIHYFSFPNYDSPSSYFVKQLLDGKYPDAGLDMVSYCYLMDMVDTLRDVVVDKPTIIVFDRYFYSQMYYLTKSIHNALRDYKNGTSYDELYEGFINHVLELSTHSCGLPKLNFLYKMYSDIENMVEVIRKRKKEKDLDIYEADIEYLRAVREVFLSDKYINKDKLRNTTGNPDNMYNIYVSNKDKERVWYDVKISIYNTLFNYKKMVDEYYEKKVE